MVPRKPLTPNNRTTKSLMREFQASGDLHVKFPKANEAPSIRIWARRGRQNSEGFGGGNRIMK